MILALKSTVLLGNFSAEKHCFTPGVLLSDFSVLQRPTERFLALKTTVLLNDYTAENCTILLGRNGNGTMSEN